MASERANAVTQKGVPYTLVGPQLKAGDKAPNFTALTTDRTPFDSTSDKGKIRLILSVPSLDTGICDAETRKFDQEAADYPGDVVVYVLSCDLPYAQKRWCGEAKINHVKALSDHLHVNFGTAYGTHVKELRILSRAIFVVDKNDVVQYVEYVPEIAQFPDYDGALAAMKKLVG